MSLAWSRSPRATDETATERAGAPRRLACAGLFAGIGGLELGLERAGHESLLMCEIEPAARAVLDARFGRVPKHDDVRSLRSLPRDVELLAAGFPCQDLSQAGKTAGIAGNQSSLVNEVFRLLERRPIPWLVLENVPFMLQLAKGQAMDVIVSALERLHYRWAYRVVDARAFGLPQRRERVFLVASLEDDPRRVLFADDTRPTDGASRSAGVACGFYWTEGIRGLGWAVNAVPTLKGGSTVGVPSPPAIWLPSGEIVTPHISDAERLQGFPPGWTRPAEAVAKRGHRWKLVGNAISVPVAVWVGKRLAKPGTPNLEGIFPVPHGSAWPRAAWNVGSGRFSAEISSWPKRVRAKPLHSFFRAKPKLLSTKATAGFLKRTKTSTLHFPPGFLDAVAAHLARMRSLDGSPSVLVSGTA